MNLLAVHIVDILPTSWWVGGFIVAIALIGLGARSIGDDEIPRLALMSAVFFVVSLIHVRFGPTSVHLLLNGLVGVVLGRRATIAIAVGLLLQAVLIGHGGFLAFGVNTCVMALPALLCAGLYILLKRIPALQRPAGRGIVVAICAAIWSWTALCWIDAALADHRGELSDWLAHPGQWLTLQPWTILTVGALSIAISLFERRMENAPDFPIGLLIGELTVLLTIAFNALVLRLALPSQAASTIAVLFAAYLPIAVVEGIVTATTVGFLSRVAPNMLVDSSSRR